MPYIELQKGKPINACLCATALIYGLALGFEARSADAPQKVEAAQNQPMKMDEPMPIKMKKEGTKKGDVKTAAEKKDREMREMMQKETQAARESAVKK